MYDIVITWHNSQDDVICGILYRGDGAPSEHELHGLSAKIDAPFTTVVVSVTMPDSPELVALDVYEVMDNAAQN